MKAELFVLNKMYCTLMYQQINKLLNEQIFEQILTYKQLNQKIDNHSSKS